MTPLTRTQQRAARLFPHLAEKLRSGAALTTGYIASTAQHLATGSKTVDDETFARRRATCNDCSSRNATTDTCTKCGCTLHRTILGDKLRRATSTCPLGKWEQHAK